MQRRYRKRPIFEYVEARSTSGIAVKRLTAPTADRDVYDSDTGAECDWETMIRLWTERELLLMDIDEEEHSLLRVTVH